MRENKDGFATVGELDSSIKLGSFAYDLLVNGGEYDNDAYRYAPLRRYMRLHGRGGLGMFNVRLMGVALE